MDMQLVELKEAPNAEDNLFAKALTAMEQSACNMISLADFEREVMGDCERLSAEIKAEHEFMLNLRAQMHQTLDAMLAGVEPRLIAQFRGQIPPMEETEFHFHVRNIYPGIRQFDISVVNGNFPGWPDHPSGYCTPHRNRITGRNPWNIDDFRNP